MSDTTAMTDLKPFNAHIAEQRARGDSFEQIVEYVRALHHGGHISQEQVDHLDWLPEELAEIEKRKQRKAEERTEEEMKMIDTKMVYQCSVLIKTAGCSADNFDELIAILEGQVEGLKAMQAAGVTMEPPAHDGWFHFTTQDVEVAKRFGMEREDLPELIEEDKSDAPVKAFDPVTGELIATGNNSEEVEEAVKGRVATIVTFPVVPLHPANKLH
jgi:hypothetical protein